MNTNFTVKFWGVRGSHPAPGPQTIIYGGNTACVSVDVAGHTILLDAGTGIIPLGRELATRARQSGQPIKAVILFSHLHHDHTLGFPFFVPAHNPAAKLHLYGPGASEQALEECLTHNQAPQVFPISLREMGAAKEIHSLLETERLVLDENGIRVVQGTEANFPSSVVIRLLKSYAHPGGSYVYRIEWRGHSVVYATDTEGYVGGDQRLIAFAKGADLLIHDAQYSQEDYAMKQGFGHSTPQMACEVARAAGVKSLALFHHDPTYDDECVHDLEEQAQALFGSAFSAREGLEIELSSSRGAAIGEMSLVRIRIAVPLAAGRG